MCPMQHRPEPALTLQGLDHESLVVTADPPPFLRPSPDQVHLSLRVLASVVVSAEEGEKADDQTHHHEQRQSDQEEAAAQGDLGTNSTNEEQDLLHPPARRTMAH